MGYSGGSPLVMFFYGTLKRGERNHEHFCGGALRVEEGAVRGDLFDFTWAILRWSFRKSPSALSGPANIEATRRSTNGLTGGGRRCWRVHASSVRSSLSTIRSRVYRPSTSWKALIPPMPLATTGGSCCLSRRTRARAFWRGPTWSSSHREATCREADGRPDAARIAIAGSLYLLNGFSCECRLLR